MSSACLVQGKYKICSRLHNSSPLVGENRFIHEKLSLNKTMYNQGHLCVCYC